jgi:small-conductance mechanosensitive channel
MLIPTLDFNDPVVQGLLNVIRAMLVLVVALTLARFAKIWAIRFFSRARVSLNLANLIGNILQVAIVALGVLTILPIFGVEPAAIVTVLGVAGLAISLSMQDLLKNVIAGTYILMEQPFRIGDRITVKEVTGTVEGIELRTTILRTDDNLQVVVPNNTVLTEVVTNRSAFKLRRQVLVVGIRQGSVTGTGQQINELLRNFEDIAHTPAPVVALESVKDGVANLRLEFWVPATARAQVTSQVVEALRTRFSDADVTVQG